jgi:hypothetical protein
MSGSDAGLSNVAMRRDRIRFVIRGLKPTVTIADRYAVESAVRVFPTEGGVKTT